MGNLGGLEQHICSTAEASAHFAAPEQRAQRFLSEHSSDIWAHKSGHQHASIDAEVSICLRMTFLNTARLETFGEG